MSVFQRSGAELRVEEVSLTEIAARHGTPCYVYSRRALTAAFEEYRQALRGRDALVCYAVKANSTLAVLDLFARLGGGFDIVSGGELARVQAVGGDPRKVVFSGVGKTEAEIRQALAAGVLCFNVESAGELTRIADIAAELGARAPIALRVNPDVDARTHPYISTGLRTNKFGVPFDEARELYAAAAASPHLRVVGIGCHIGSQLLEPEPIVEAAVKVLGFIERLGAAGIRLEHIDLGGGLGIRYQDESPPAVADYLGPLLSLFAGRPERLLFEPGRRLVGNAGVLLTRVEYLKLGPERNFAIVDAAMNDLMRPALYDAFHEIVPVVERTDTPRATYEVVGPVCESGDFLGNGRDLSIRPGDLLAVMSAGAYGMAMSSNYNTRPRAAEVLVDAATAHLVRRRESVESLYALESRVPA